MNADFTIRSAGPSALTDLARPTPVAARDGVATQLASEQTVAPAANADASRNDAASQNRNKETERQARQTRFDPATAEFVYRVIDNETRRVVRQVPDQAMLRLRAYTRAQQSVEASISEQRSQLQRIDSHA
jgi:uncharacterized FlaG/YvyC family protein